MQHPLAASRKAQPVGVIDTLSAGYVALHRQLWVLALPILLNLVLWLGPHVSLSPLIGPALTRVADWTHLVAPAPTAASVARRATPGASAGDASATAALAASVDASRLYLLSHADELNGLSALAWAPIAPPTSASLPDASADMAFVQSPLDALLLLGGCLGLSLVLGAWFYGGLAAAARPGRASPVLGVLDAGRDVPRAILHVLGLMAVLLGSALLLGVPVVLLLAITLVIAPPVAALGSLLLLGALLFAGIHLFFAIDAIFVGRAGPLAAIQRSVGVVRTHIRASLGLIFLTWLILAGMDRVWDALASSLQSPVGIAVGILGNAYIASGLIVAGMIFYTQRSGDFAEQR